MTWGLIRFGKHEALKMRWSRLKLDGKIIKGLSSLYCVRDALWQQLLLLLVTTAKASRDTPGPRVTFCIIINCPGLHCPAQLLLLNPFTFYILLSSGKICWRLVNGNVQGSWSWKLFCYLLEIIRNESHSIQYFLFWQDSRDVSILLPDSHIQREWEWVVLIPYDLEESGYWPRPSQAAAREARGQDGVDCLPPLGMRQLSLAAFLLPRPSLRCMRRLCCMPGKCFV